MQLIQGDITEARVDAIVNAANSVMLGGGGVDGAIHSAAGPDLLQACREVPAVDGVRCATGEARITRAGELNAQYVIHTVGPRYGLDPQPRALLASAYRNSLQLAQQHQCETIACPAISCGVYRYPLNQAAEVAFEVCQEPEFQDLDIRFYLFNDNIFACWSALLSVDAIAF
jgi:O-acetyl-ADP-ribose deacetylase (regulator of RNase III)